MLTPLFEREHYQYYGNGKEVPLMPGKARERRVWCSRMLILQLESRSGRARKLNVNLKEIWRSGALFQTDVRIRPLTRLRLACSGCEFDGRAVSRTSSQCRPPLLKFSNDYHRKRGLPMLLQPERLAMEHPIGDHHTLARRERSDREPIGAPRTRASIQ